MFVVVGLVGADHAADAPSLHVALPGRADDLAADAVVAFSIQVRTGRVEFADADFRVSGEPVAAGGELAEGQAAVGIAEAVGDVEGLALAAAGCEAILQENLLSYHLSLFIVTSAETTKSNAENMVSVSIVILRRIIL